MKAITPNELKTRRSRMGLSQTALALKLSRSLPTIQRWEAGSSPIPLELDLALQYLAVMDFVDRLKAAVTRVEKEYLQKDMDVEIPLWLAREFLGWSEQDWEELFGEWMTGTDCQRAAGGLFREGEKFFDSLRIGHMRIRVATESSNSIVLNVERANKRITKTIILFPTKKRSQPEEDGNRVPASPGNGADADPDFV